MASKQKNNDNDATKTTTPAVTCLAALLQIARDTTGDNTRDR